MARVPYYQDDLVTLHLGDCLDILPELPDDSVDAVTTDPPYGLEFMGKDWDKFAPSGLGDGSNRMAAPSWSRGAWQNKRCTNCGHIASGGSPCRCLSPIWTVETGKSNAAAYAFQAWCEQWAAECLRILKPGGHLLAFGGTRTSHRLACAVEDAGFEIRDSIAWLYSQGFPKSLSVGRAIDGRFCRLAGTHSDDPEHDCPTTPEGDEWRGFGTALKPAFEPVCMARKPLVGVAANVLRWGTGALNIDGGRIGGGPIRTGLKADGSRSQKVGHEGWDRPWKQGAQRDERCELHGIDRCTICLPSAASGRWPANVALDESQAAALDQMSGETTSSSDPDRFLGTRGGQTAYNAGIAAPGGALLGQERAVYGDVGGASRFFFVARDQSAKLDPCPSPNSASDAASLSNRPNVPGDSAPRAANQEPKTDLSRSARSTSETPSGSSPTSGSDTPAILSTDSKSSPESRPPRHTPTSSLASDAEQPEPTDTTTTTASPSTSAGSAAPATPPITSRPREVGAAALPIESLGSRFTYTSKASSDERVTVNGVSHPTVKSLSLMRWLVRLVCPPGGTLVDPFAGSGTTVEAALLEGFHCIAIEREADYLPLITQRINRRRDPIAYLTAAGEDLGLFGGVA